MTVSQILNTKGRNVITASSDQTVLAVSRVLADKRIGAVVVVDSKGRIEGIASERDFVKAIEPLCLFYCPREAIKNESAGAIRLLEAFLDHVADQLVGD